MAATLGIASGGQAQTNNDMNKQAIEIVSKMTLAEKIGQMAQVSIDAVCKGEDTPPTSTLQLDMDKLRDVIVNYHVGSLLNSPNTRARTAEWWTNVISQIQDVALNETRSNSRGNLYSRINYVSAGDCISCHMESCPC